MSNPVTDLKAGSGVSRFLTLVLPIVVACACVWMARPQAAAERGDAVSNDRDAVQSVHGDHPASLSDAKTVSLPAASPKLITRPIEDICPGMRVLASNPEETESLADSDVTAEDWRLVSLTMTKEDGGTLRVQLLRPIEWLVTEAVILIADADDPQSLFVNVPSIPAAPDTEDYKLQRLLLGQTIHLDLPELGAQGPAMVTAIDPCPPVDKPQPGRRMVTGTFRHSAANVVDLQVGSESESFGVTDNHPFWSVDRGEFVEAGLLRIGEQLQCADGTITQVTRITPRRGPPVEVYNFEVDAEHVYHVGTSGVLVHNACHHHYWPKWLGSQVPYRDRLLTPMGGGAHKKLHDALRTFLQSRYPNLMHSSSNPGKFIQVTNRMRDRLAALDDFYSTYQGGKHLQKFRDEVLETIMRGLGI